MSFESFMKTYSNLPLNVREEIILVIQLENKDTPITWDVAYIEIKGKTKLGTEILKRLEKLKII